MDIDTIIEAQQSFCAQQGCDCWPSEPNMKAGVAIKTIDKLPINGLRHPPHDDTNGWYIWGGEELSSDPEFFSPLHIRHLLGRSPQIIKLLGLPPGYRFLIAGDYLDVWYDPSLLNV
jgi:hypothetical protein